MNFKSLLLTLVLSFAFLNVLAKDILYVKTGASGDGSSWTKAFGDIQQAVDSASKIGADVWVSKGVYTSDSSAVVFLKPNVSLYGGFAGNESDLALRDTAKNPTVLDGGGKIQVINQSSDFADSSAVIIDGFTIQNGYAENGGGAYLKSNATLSNCIVKNCQAVDYGTAIYSVGGNVVKSLICNNGGIDDYKTNREATLYMMGGSLDKCIVKDNFALHYGALNANSVSVSNSVFEGNASQYQLIELYESSMEDCKIVNNETKNHTPNMIELREGSILNRCLIDGNNNFNILLAANSGSVVSNTQISNCKGTNRCIIYLYSSSKLINCTVVDNQSNEAVVESRYNNHIINSIIVGNQHSENYGAYRLYYNVTVNNSFIEGGAEGVGNIDGNKARVAFTDTASGDYSLSEKSLCINAGIDVADTLDLAGNKRKQFGSVDMGAIESSFSRKANIGSIIYVKEGATGSGSSWDDALGEINQAITLASSTGKRHQVWVAKGTYFGDASQYSSISLAPGVSIYGGFDGTETSMDKRNIEKNPTLIDGGSKRRCIIQNFDFTDSMSVVVDGFTIQNGYTTQEGSCVSSKKNSTFRNCIFKNAKKGNEVAKAVGSSFIKCTFTDNDITEVDINEGFVDSCIFKGSSSKTNSPIIEAQKSKISNSVIEGYNTNYTCIKANYSNISGCKIANNVSENSDLIYLFTSILENSLVYANTVDRGGESVIWSEYQSSIINSTIAYNTTKNFNIIRYTYSYSDKPEIVSNSIIFGNKITDKVLPPVMESANIRVSNCASDGVLTGENNIVLSSSNSGSDSTQNYVRFINPAGGDFRLHATSSCIDRGIDSIMTYSTDINGNARIYGRTVDLGAIEYNGEYVQIVEYGESVCHNRKSSEAVFDSTIYRIEWKIASTGKVVGYDSISGSGSSIPSMTLSTSKNDIDTLTLLVTPYDKSGNALTPFNYFYYVYPDFSEKKVTFKRPELRYFVNMSNTNVTIEWNKLTLPVDVDKYDLYVWKSSHKMPSTPNSSFLKDHTKYLSDLDNHTTYRYMVQAIVACDTITSDIDSFRIDIPVSLKMEGNVNCIFGSKLNETSSLTRYLKGFELTDSITCTLSGKDASNFSFQYGSGWDKFKGGALNISYTSTDLKKLTSEAELTIRSGKHEITLYLSGSLSNYYVYDAIIENTTYRAGDSVDVIGIVTDAYDTPIAGKAVTIEANSNTGFYHSASGVTDSVGKVKVKIATENYECGTYMIKVYANSSNDNVPYTDSEFDIPGMYYTGGTIKWVIQKGDTISGTVSVSNKSSVALHNIIVDYRELAEGLIVDFDTLKVLDGGSTARIPFKATGTKITEGKTYLPSVFRVSCDEDVTCDFSTYFYCEYPYGQIKVSPANINEYVSKQKPKYINIKLVNTGFGETGEISLSVPEFKGFSVASAKLPSIKSGDTANVSLTVSYYQDAPINVPFSGTVGVNCENGKSTSLPFKIEYVSESIGSLVVDVVDEYFYNTSSKKHLGGAKVVVRNQFNNKEVASGISDSTGVVKFDSIPEGTYLMSVRADKHSEYQETIVIQAGHTLDKFVFLAYQAITYTWKVERTEIEDKYNIDLDLEFETNVPAPVVTISFPNGLPNKDRIVAGQPRKVMLQVTNHGMIAARYVKFGIQNCPNFVFYSPITYIDSLPANHTEFIPITIARVNEGDGFNGGEPLPSSGSGRADCPVLHADYSYKCGQLRQNTAVVKTWNDCDSLVYLDGRGGIYSSDNTHHQKCDTCEVSDDYGGIEFPNLFGSLSGLDFSFLSGVPCNSCWSKIDGTDCVKDVVEEAPIVGPAVNYGIDVYTSGIWQATFSKSDTYNNINTAVDGAIIVGEYFSDPDHFDEYKAVDYAYDVITGLPIVDKAPWGCLDFGCQTLSCISGRYAKNCGRFLVDLFLGRHEEDEDTREIVTASGDTVVIEDGVMTDVRYADGSSLKEEGKQANKYELAKAGFDLPDSYYSMADARTLAGNDAAEFMGFLQYRTEMMTEFAGSKEVMAKEGITDYFDFTISKYTSLQKIDIDSVKNLPTAELSTTEMVEMAQRWNETLVARENGVYSPNQDYLNIVDDKVISAYVDSIVNFLTYMTLRGFDSPSDMLLSINREINKPSQNGVCASIKLRISQTLTMTREAFDGTLTVSNGNESGSMKGVKIVIEVRDEEGNLANDLFQINTEKLSGISSIDGNGEISAKSEGTALFRFIPEKGAAPTSPKNYSFGGYLVYVDPSSGDTVKADFYPVTLTVNPSPDLQIDYFMQRNILGDDALTLDRVEPSIPAALGVRIDNQGYGIAKNVKLETAQPEVVENEKGLLIDFAIIGSSLDGKEKNLGSENIDFGNIDPQSAKTGVWWLTSSLLGHFTKYEASVVHANSYGNPELSLVKGIAVHELIKTVDAYGVKEDNVLDFLVNDNKDDHDTPDAIYYSSGGKDEVYEAQSVSLDKSKVADNDTVVTLTVTPSRSGWNYTQTSDPGRNVYEIQKVVRVKDGAEIPLDNVWSTFVTLPDGGSPIYENRLHFLDYMTTMGENDYDIYYSLKKNLLEVSDIRGVPHDAVAVTSPVDSVVIKFSRPIKPESFDYSDIEIFFQGGKNLSDSSVTVRPIDDRTFTVDISSKTDSSGFYKIEVNVIDVFDSNGYPGEIGRNATWSQLVDENAHHHTVTPVVPDTLAPVDPDTVAPIVPDTLSPVEQDTVAPIVPDALSPVEQDTIAPVVPDTVSPVVPDTLAPIDPDDVDDDHNSDDQNGDNPDHGTDFPTAIAEIKNDDIVIFVSENCIYVKSSSEGYVDIYDILSRLVVQNAHYREGVTNVAVLPKGTYIIKGKKVIVY